MGAARQRGEAESLDRDRVHHILSNARRRTALRVLREAGEPITVRELSERVATAETDEDPAPRDVRHTVYVSLQQNHLPQLTEHDVVEVDESSKTVALGRAAPAVTAYGDEARTTAHGIYGAVAAAGLLAALAAVGGVPVVAALPAAGYAAAALLAVLVTSLAGLSGDR